MPRTFGALVVGLLAAGIAHAHFPFIVPDESGTAAKVVFSDSLAPDPNVKIEKLESTKLFLRETGTSKDASLSWKKGEACYEVAVPGKVRYKSLLIEVKVCETRGANDPQPKPSAYLDVTSDPRGASRGALVDRKQVFKGWMFANAPGVHALQHPTYDLWLIACGAAPAQTK